MSSADVHEHGSMRAFNICPFAPYDFLEDAEGAAGDACDVERFTC